MIFTSLSFLLFFLGFVVIYYLLKGKSRLLWMLVASYFFYGWWDWRFVFLLIISSILTYVTGLMLGETAEKNRRMWFLLHVVLSLVILGFFKYFNFFSASLESLLSLFGVKLDAVTLSIILPVGISFFTFQGISYTFDVYRRKLDPEKNFLDLAVCVSFFPHLVAGPIVRLATFLPQLKADQPFIADNIIKGTLYVAWGFLLKVGLANTLANVADLRFAAPENHSAFSLLVGVVAYSFQIYGDFAGYSIMAIGLARIVGITFCKNFERPYFSRSFTEFWQRWHISLSSWLRDYLYIPLGGNRKGEMRTSVNLFLTMVIGGLWHGAAWTFVIWGAIHGVLQIIQKKMNMLMTPVMIRYRTNILVTVIMPLLVVQTCILITWVYFRSSSLQVANGIVLRILFEGNWSFGSIQNAFLVLKGFLTIFFVVFVDYLIEKHRLTSIVAGSRLLQGVALVVIVCWVSFLGTFGDSAFIYFQF